MKTLQLSKFYPPINGGIETVAYELTEGLNDLGIPTDVLCSANGRKTLHETSEKGYAITRAGSLGKILSTSISPALVSLVWRLSSNYDLIHLHMPNPMAALALWLTKPKAKLITHWHSDVVHQRRALKFYTPLQNWILERSAAIIATSEPYLATSKALQPWKSKAHVIPIGITPIDTSNSHKAVEVIKDRYQNRDIIFSLGRMTTYKGFDVLIDAAQFIHEDSVILVGGSGELLDHYRSRVIAEKLQKKIMFLGHIHDYELPAYFEAASVFCLPSNARSEAFGVVQLEAMASGKPIVATNIPGSGVSWVNQHGITGLNVPIKDSKSLAEALQTILLDKNLAMKMSKAGKERFCQEFSSQTMINRTAALYEKIARSKF